MSVTGARRPRRPGLVFTILSTLEFSSGSCLSLKSWTVRRLGPNQVFWAGCGLACVALGAEQGSKEALLILGWLVKGFGAGIIVRAEWLWIVVFGSDVLLPGGSPLPARLVWGTLRRRCRFVTRDFLQDPDETVNKPRFFASQLYPSF